MVLHEQRSEMDKYKIWTKLVAFAKHFGNQDKSLINVLLLGKASCRRSICQYKKSIYSWTKIFDEDCTSGVMPLVLQNPSALPTVLMEQKLPTMRHHMTSTPSCTMEFTRKFECYKIFQYGWELDKSTVKNR
jgi:hypothetical protein